MVALEFIRAYLDDLLCITKASLEIHLDKLKMVLTRLQDAGLQVNICKLSFCNIEKEYLEYILPHDGIKTKQNKQAILAITPPKQVKDIRSFLGMVQYYRDLWAQCNKLLAPLTTLIGECGHTKVTKAKKTKKCPWP